MLQALHKELLAKCGSPNLLAPYMVTPPEVLERVLELAAVGAGDTVFDIGCGDARLLCAAARLGARGFGWDIDPAAIADAKARIAQENIGDKVTVVLADALAESLPWADATVIVLYMGVRGNLRLREPLLAHSRNGTRVVTVQFHMGRWQPREEIRVDCPDHHRDMPVVPLRLYVVDDACRALVHTTEAELSEFATSVLT
eukprot:TRINITY_DN23495_c0_g1_i1.p1 TRINITY_DN23495_c0_g1~~TRINITY_DN23495_c0_g1_i1.p1  ORF type:complete len:200 (+),score=37.10 TRINITY_DN23495_c0_g1_i1:365-964(+)